MNNYPKILLVQSLAEAVYWAKRCYYDGHETINDEVYDKLEYELKRLCPNHPILELVGNPGDTWDNPGMMGTIQLMTDNDKELPEEKND